MAVIVDDTDRFNSTFFISGLPDCRELQPNLILPQNQNATDYTDQARAAPLISR